MRRDRLAGATTPDDELVELIYGALLGESPWQKFLNRLADSAPSGKTLLVLHDQRKNNGYIPLASGIPQDVLHAYNSHFARINPFMKPASVKPVGVGLIDEELMPSSELIKSEFFNDLLKPHEMPARVALTINRDSGYQFVLASLGNAFDEECKLNIANQLTRLYPHLKRASDYYRNNPDISAATELGSSLFDAIDVGLVIVGDRARMKAVSRTGELMLSRSSAISVSTLGTVSLRDPNAHAVLKDMLGRTYTGPKVVGIATATTELTMVRLQRDDISTFFDGPTVALLMGFSSDQRSVSLGSVAERFGLTKSEMRAVAGLIRGKTVNEIADEAKLSRGTVREQLKSVFNKTGTHRQLELAHLVWFGRHPGGDPSEDPS